eukprot:5246119-Amphidinium_carterae.1
MHRFSKSVPQTTTFGQQCIRHTQAQCMPCHQYDLNFEQWASGKQRPTRRATIHCLLYRPIPALQPA